MKTYKNIAELLKAIKSGEIDESQLEIVLDNDITSFWYGKETGAEIKVESANGYYDIEELYKLLFPEALVDWC